MLKLYLNKGPSSFWFHIFEKHLEHFQKLIIINNTKYVLRIYSLDSIYIYTVECLLNLYFNKIYSLLMRHFYYKKKKKTDNIEPTHICISTSDNFKYYCPA